MKRLLVAGALAAAISAGTVSANGGYEEPPEDCCKAKAYIELEGEIECECDLFFLNNLAFQGLNLAPGLKDNGTLLEGGCNTGGDLEITLHSANGGFLVHTNGINQIGYEIAVAGILPLTQLLMDETVPYDGAPHLVTLNILAGPPPIAGTYSDLVTMTIMPM